MRDRSSIGSETVTVSVELPRDVAEQLVEHGPALLDALRQALQDQTQSEEVSTERDQLRNKEARDRIGEWERLSRHLDRHLRQRCARGGEPESRVFREFARQYGFKVSHLRNLHSGFKKRRNERIKERRTARIIRLYCLGYSNREIARLVRPKVAPDTVKRILTENRELIGSLRAFDRQRRKVFSASAPARREAHEIGNELEIFETAEEAQEERQKHHAEIGRDLYAEWRKRRPSPRDRHHVLREFAQRHKLPVPYIEHLLRTARQEERQARDAEVIQLYRQKLKNTEIARETGLHDRTVARIIREHRGAQRSGNRLSHDTREAGHV